MTPIATLKTNPTPERIRKILTRAAADGAYTVVIHLPQTSEDKICFFIYWFQNRHPDRKNWNDRTFPLRPFPLRQHPF